MARVLILSGSARKDGNTALVVERLRLALGGAATVVDLADPPIAPFSYEDRDREDAFKPVVEAMLAHDRLVFATPVYWYAMSGVTKTFLDRFTDLLGKPEGRGLATQAMMLLANGTDPALPPGFETPFRLTAGYFGMAYEGAAYVAFTRDGEMAPDESERFHALASWARAEGFRP